MIPDQTCDPPSKHPRGSIGHQQLVIYLLRVRGIRRRWCIASNHRPKSTLPGPSMPVLALLYLTFQRMPIRCCSLAKSDGDRSHSQSVFKNTAVICVKMNRNGRIELNSDIVLHHALFTVNEFRVTMRKRVLQGWCITKTVLEFGILWFFGICYIMFYLEYYKL